MQRRLSITWAMTAISLLSLSTRRADAQVVVKTSNAAAPYARELARKAIDRGLAFLEADAATWRTEHSCATCHHGTMTVWALSEAKGQGYAVVETLSDVTKWTRERLTSIDKPRDTRPGWNMVNTPAVYLALMAQAVPAQDAVGRDDLKRIAGHLLRHQEANGSWAWSLAPAGNRPPPVFESDEVVTIMAEIDLGPEVPRDPGKASPAREARARAAAWLEKNTQPDASTQATALRLFRDVRAGKSPKDLEPGIERLLALQNADGGWGQVKGLPSDAYATGQALYFLGLAGVARDRAEIRRAVMFLVAKQKPDGSWPMASRAHPGAKPFTNPVPITYFGTAWATLGLLRSVPK
jgi:hypothetical protein